jgi:serine/threonine protein kinase/aspartate 1-decarboxylase
MAAYYIRNFFDKQRSQREIERVARTAEEKERRGSKQMRGGSTRERTMTKHASYQQLGNYRLIRQLGAGGFAEVYLGEHSYLKTLVAIKVLRTPVSLQEMQHFLKEARTLSLLNHPHILRVLDFGVDGAIPFLVMEYVAGGTLHQCYPRGSMVPVPCMLSYVKQIAAALMYAHEHKVIHRDVKPENMLVGRDGGILLSDFGIAVAAHSTASLKTVDAAGTPAYMAPEQIQGRPRPASDQYALAMVVYEWFCGARPFSGDAMQVLYQQIHNPPPPLRSKGSAISSDVEKVVQKALTKDPEHRFPTVEAFANALEDACQRRSRRTSRSCTYHGHSSLVSALAWSPDGTRIASTDYDERVHIWDARTGISVSIDNYAGCPGPAGAITWSPDGSHIALGNRSTAALVRMLATKQKQDFDGICGKVDAIAWSYNGSRLASGSIGKVYGDNLAYVVQVWETASGQNIFTQYFYLPLGKRRDWLSLSAKGGFVSMQWLPDNTRMIFVNLDKTVETWNVSSQRAVSRLHFQERNDEAQMVVLSPDGRYAASVMADQTVEVWNTASGNRICTYRGHQDQVNVVAWSPDAKHIASGSQDATIQVWNAKTGQQIFTYRGHTGSVHVVAWSPDAKYIASASSDRTVRTWQVEGL